MLFFSRPYSRNDIGVTASQRLASEFRQVMQDMLVEFPWQVRLTDWTGRSYAIGRNEAHWRDLPLYIDVKTEAAGRDIINSKPLRFLERFLDGEVCMRGNLYLLSDIRRYGKVSLSLWQLLPQLVASKSVLFQSIARARSSVRTHYDIPQEALSKYLDAVFMSYSCAIFEQPNRLEVKELLEVGAGKTDSFDSLEKAQWRKYKDAVDYIAPREGETLLDIGCGYGGQLLVALEEQPFAKVVGWTHSSNQASKGRDRLSHHDRHRWEIHEGDYRQERRIFDHITSTGMVSHVGPRGLVPYVKNTRKMIRAGGRYLHHALMNPHSERLFDLNVGVAFNKKYVWPGFHWFSLGEHVTALESNGFEIVKLINLSPHYAKTTAAWYERMMASEHDMIAIMGRKAFLAWQIYLAGSSAGFQSGIMHVYRLYCRAI